eukprot:CAMPEP_0176436144 /NCGR_PEP_ID=MMETSP0127-20121128/17774_1 /TAXON_ID=938130 /ORGANISM="Platyophrya macrostoma, Strain WH" /LENGTH=137 /DNA_ID=CAMNT_0017819369 /DNA_START=37 /DNA_END=450 /DNA_ORIENTATION=+
MKAIFALFAIFAVASAGVVQNDCATDVICKTNALELNSDPVKGNPIGMKWKLDCGQHEFISNLHIYVAFNGFSFHEEEVDQKIEVAGGSQGEIDYSVLIPSFAPSGHYQVNLTAQGNADDAGKRDTTLNCVSVEFDL